VLALEPAFAPAQTILGLAYQQLDSSEEALTELENARVCSEGHPAALGALGYVYGRLRYREQDQKILDELTALGKRQHVSPYWFAQIHAGFGRRRMALEALESAYSQCDPLLVWLNMDPRFDSLSEEPGFIDLRRRIAR
jgi:tetratricopeptide (TPR) repeat protein